MIIMIMIIIMIIIIEDYVIYSKMRKNESPRKSSIVSRNKTNWKEKEKNER